MTETSVKIPALEFVELLSAHGFQELEGNYHPENFGNVALVYSNQDFSIRLSKDRGEVFVDIGPPTEKRSWFPVESVVEYLEGATAVEDLGAPPQAGKLAEKLSHNYERIRNLFHSSSACADLSSFEKAKSQKFARNLFGLV